MLVSVLVFFKFEKDCWFSIKKKNKLTEVDLVLE